MALIGLILSDEETAERLETALGDAGHRVRQVDLDESDEDGMKAVDMFVVDIDGSERNALESVRRLGEEPTTALKPTLVAGSSESANALADACAYGASGYLRKPFLSVETVPDTERALIASLK